MSLTRIHGASMYGYLLSFLLVLLCLGGSAGAQETLSTDAVYQTRYLAAHGTRALVGGDTAAGLEAWVYPLQIVRGLQPFFRVGAASTTMPGSTLLRTIVYGPTYVERVFQGPEFTVHERLFVPRDLPGAVLTYTVESSEPVTVELAFTPVFDLMWPVGLGGQEIHWQAIAKAYRLDEPTGRFFAMIGSAEMQTHDDLVNTHAPLNAEPRLHLMLGPAKRVRLLLASDAAGWSATQAVYATLLAKSDDLERQAAEAAARVRAESTVIETPDRSVNDALAWSETALDQAWVCNPSLGCGLVAGYGPSRGMARRPQYAWFFADDALVSLPALLFSGAFTRARDTLLFLMRYQDARSGMMWHELSQSAASVDWVRDYPYMFPHVDVSFRFLAGVADYVRATGDVAFLRAHWQSISAAYRFCTSLVDAGDGLPRVPPGKEGHNEQEHPREELELAVDWTQAASAFAALAADAGHPDVQAAAENAAERARGAIPAHFWNPDTGFWNSGLDAAGKGLGQLRLPSPASLNLLNEPRRAQVLNRIAGGGFETPWGARDIDTSSRGYDANSYATGSVWAASTAIAAEDLWQGGRSTQAWQVWRKLLPWLSLDSMGHLHETLSGAAFRPQLESVPEQTWSSALLFSSFLKGLAGIKVDAARHELVFAPQLPADWPTFGLKRLRVGDASIDLDLKQDSAGLELTAAAHSGDVSLLFRPALLAGSTVDRVLLDGRPTCAKKAEAGTGCTALLLRDGKPHTISVRFRRAS